MDLLEFMMELDIYYNLELKNMISFTTGLDILYELKLVLHITVIFHSYEKTKVDSYDSFPLEKNIDFA